jgi:hypothetical protein
MGGVNMIEHDERREAKVQLLVEKILDCTAEYSYNPNGFDIWSCPYCFEEASGDNENLEDIAHAIDCPYLIAKSLKR